MEVRIESGVLPHLPPLGPGSIPTGGTMWIGFFSPYLTLWVFSGTILWGFPPTSKTENFFIVFSPCLDC